MGPPEKEKKKRANNFPQTNSSATTTVECCWLDVRPPLQACVGLSIAQSQVCTKMKLTKVMISSRTRQDSLGAIRNLNLWGANLVDVSILESMPNVEVLSLSLNGITSLEVFGRCKKLRELYLRKNKVADLEEIAYLQALPNLEVLWLSENPCSEAPGYRSFVLSRLPRLKKLDNKDVTADELEDVLRQNQERRRAAEAQGGGRRTEGPGGPAPLPRPQQPSQERPWQPAPSPVPQQPSQNPPPRARDIPTPSGVSEKRQRELRHNILGAILSLLETLDEGGLAWVKKEVDQRLTAEQKKR